MPRHDISSSEIIALYGSGHSSYEVAKRLGCTQPTIISRLKAAGVKRRTKWERQTSATPESVIALYRSGLGVPTIAKQVGVTNRAIYLRLRSAGVVIRKDAYPSRKGASNPSWRGGRHLSRGYVMVNVGTKNYQFEHRIVMEHMLGRPLKAHEIVHHMNGIRSDNRPENLTLTTRKDHEHYTYVKRLQARIRELERAIR